MNHRRKTALILFSFSVAMLSPFIMNLAGFRNPLFQNLGFVGDNIAPLTAWVLALIVAFAYILYTFKRIPLVKAMQAEVSLFKCIGILAALASGLMEEVIFRRWLMDVLAYIGYGEVVQVISSAVLFGLGHGIWLFFKGEIRFAIPAIGSTTMLGAALAIVYLVSGRNLGPCILAHAFINMVIEPWLMLSSVSGEWKIKEQH